jgi:hypothetical protein
MTGAAAAWSDYDGDGDPDLALIGFSSATAETGSIYRNDGNGQFTLVFQLTRPVADGSVSWGDFDHDGDPDLMVTGQNGGPGPIATTTLYRNDGNDTFLPIIDALPGLIGVARWIDFDQDGWPDVIMSGIGSTFIADSTRLFHNDTTGTFIEIPVDLPGYLASDISIADFDNDGDPDFFLTGGTLSSSTFPISRLFRNDGNGVFTPVALPFKNLSTGTSAWGDYDHDGDLDLLYDGIDSTFANGFTLLYRNDSMGQFTLIDAHLPGSGEPGSVSWADMDHDGDLDILLGGPTTLLRNDGNDQYTDITPVTFLPGVPNTFADIDNDGDQDVLIISPSGGSSASSVYRNDLVTTRTEFQEPIAFNLYPNPAIRTLHLTSNNMTTGNMELVILNGAGNKVYRQSINCSPVNGLTINVSSLPPSVYFYTMMQNGRLVQSGKFVMSGGE